LQVAVEGNRGGGVPMPENDCYSATQAGTHRSSIVFILVNGERLATP
jgi:hypothetical protein